MTGMLSDELDTSWPIVTLPEARDSVHIIYEDGFASIGSAWRFMLEHGKRLADSHGVKPENLMLGQWSSLFVVQYLHLIRL